MLIIIRETAADGGVAPALRFGSLLCDLCMNKDVILAALWSQKGPGLGNKFKTDPAIFKVAFLHGKAGWYDIPIYA